MIGIEADCVSSATWMNELTPKLHFTAAGLPGIPSDTHSLLKLQCPGLERAVL